MQTPFIHNRYGDTYPLDERFRVCKDVPYPDCVDKLTVLCDERGTIIPTNDDKKIRYPLCSAVTTTIVATPIASTTVC